jgi:hypothetical protein
LVSRSPCSMSPEHVPRPCRNQVFSAYAMNPNAPIDFVRFS